MRKIFVALSVAASLQATTLPELFSALKNHAQTKADEMQVKRAKVAHTLATSKLYPKIDLFATYDNYSTPNGMIPLAPDHMLGLVKDPSKPSQPFSYNIYKAGAKFTMPIFVKSIYTMANKAKAMQRSAKAKKRIDLLQNEAVIVASNANLLYLKELARSLELKRKSLLETKKTIRIKVETGRAPESALYKIDDALNQIDIAKNNIDLQKEKLISSIESLTGIHLDTPVEMHQAGELHFESMGALRPLQEKLKASKIELSVQKEKLYPSVFAHGSYAYSRAKAYNTHDNINEEFGNIGVVVDIPLLAMDQYKSIEKAKVEYEADSVELEKTQAQLQAKAKMLKETLPLLDRSIALAQKNIKNKEKLLDIAKVSFKSGRLPAEEYLRYEDEVVSAKAALYEAEAKKWQSTVELAVIYANNIEELVK